MGELRRRGNVWWIRYYRAGRRYEESSDSEKKGAATDLLKIREGDGAHGLPVTPRIGRVRFEDLAKDIINEYIANERKSLGHLKRRIRLHLTPFFGGRRMSTVTTVDVRAFVAARQEAKAGPAEINLELAVLKRMYTLAVQAGRLLHRPHIPMLELHNVRAGFFEREQFEAVRQHLPKDLREVATFAYCTGWRVPSEVLTLQWRQVDFKAGIVRLEPDSTKNDEGRTFPFDALPDLKDALEAQRMRTPEGTICPWVFHRAGAPFSDEDGAASKVFRKAWRIACQAAGCPGRIPHDFRRTAVRNLVRAGVPEKVAMSLTGHKTRSVFDRYDIVNEADLREAVGRLANAAGTKKGQSRGQGRVSAFKQARN
jgi:integrase